MRGEWLELLYVWYRFIVKKELKKPQLTGGINNFGMGKKTHGQKSSNISSNVISTLEARAVELLKDEAKYKPGAKVQTSNTKFKNAARNLKQVAQKRKSTNANNMFSTNGQLTINTVDSVEYTDVTIGPSSVKNTVSDVSRKMFMKHLKSPLSSNELYSSLKDSHT
jgi:hypothetical protein